MRKWSRARAWGTATAAMLVASLLVAVAPSAATAVEPTTLTGVVFTDDPPPVDPPAPEPDPAPAPYVSSTPQISGKVAVGSTLTAKPGSWTSGSTFTYRWYANGKAISKATTSTLKLTKAVKGKRISVRVVGKKAGYTAVAKTSAKTPRVATAATPKISGSKQVGKTLRVVRGTWTPGTKFSYQWLADGKPITKAKKSTLKITKSLKPKKITVTVTGKKAGYATVSKTSTTPKRTSRWIEVDLSSQTMTMREGSKAVATYKVSTGTKSHPTKTGTFKIRAKLRIQNMGNPNLSRPPYYYTKNVPWVMYFNGDQALHGAYWHNNFGRVMSHGCVNLPVNVAKKLYAWAKVGTTVVVKR